jgi:LPXTG-motif cell wall-anchored protein
MTLVAKLGWAALAGLIFAVLAGGTLVDASAETDIGPINGPATVEEDCSTGVTDERGICQPVGCCEEAPTGEDEWVDVTVTTAVEPVDIPGDVCLQRNGVILPEGGFVTEMSYAPFEGSTGTMRYSFFTCGPILEATVAVADPPTVTLPATGSATAIQTALAALLLILGPAALWVARR